MEAAYSYNTTSQMTIIFNTEIFEDYFNTPRIIQFHLPNLSYVQNLYLLFSACAGILGDHYNHYSDNIPTAFTWILKIPAPRKFG
jgi:hypothetical protein